MIRRRPRRITRCSPCIIPLIIKITISSIVIRLKNSYFPLIHLPSCYRTVYYRTVQQTNQIQSGSLNQPMTFKVVVKINQSQPWFQSL